MPPHHPIGSPSGDPPPLSLGRGTLIESTLRRRAGAILALYWPTLAILTHLPQAKVEPVSFGNTGWDTPAHTACFALLTILLTHTLYRRLAPRVAIPLAAVIATAYAAVDEVTQGWFGRNVEARDFLANLGGIAISLAAICVQHIWDRSAPLTPALDLTPAPGSASDPPSPPTGQQQDRLHDQPQPSFVGHARLVSLLTLGSRLLGLARDAVIAACFGMTTVTDAFWLAFLIPNLFRRLFGEGALAAAFIPVYSQLTAHDQAKARQLAWACAVALLAGLGAVALVGIGCLSWAVHALSLEPHTHLAISLTQIMLPYTPMICLVALLGAMLQVHHRFGPAAIMPVVLNLAMIAGALTAATWPPDTAPSSQSLSMTHGQPAIHFVAYAVVVAGVIQVVWMVIAARHCQPLTWDWSGIRPHVGSIVAAMVPVAAGLAVFQVNVLLDSLIAWTLSPKADDPNATLNLWGYRLAYPVLPGSVTALQLAGRLYQFPLGVFGIALATAIFPALSSAAVQQASKSHPSAAPTPAHRPADPRAFTAILKQGLRLTMFVGLPASVGLILIRLPLTRVIFERHQFTADDSMQVAVILAGYASAIWAYSMTHVLTRSFYAVRQPRTPLKITLAMVGLNLLLNLTLVWYLGAAALAWSTALCAVIQTAILLLVVRTHTGPILTAEVWSSFLRSAGLTGTMAAVLLPIAYHLPDPAACSRTQCVGQLAVMIGLGTAVVGIGAMWARAPELDWLLSRRTNKQENL